LDPVSLSSLSLFYYISRPWGCGAQPFYNDDTDVTGKGKFQPADRQRVRSAAKNTFPAEDQNTTIAEWITGITKGVEVGVDLPLAEDSNAPVTIPNTAFGIGDTSFHVKYNFLKESGGSRWPRWR